MSLGMGRKYFLVCAVLVLLLSCIEKKNNAVSEQPSEIEQDNSEDTSQNILNNPLSAEEVRELISENEVYIKSNIFDNNIFEGISLSPDHYRGRNFVTNEYIPEYGSYSDRTGADLVVIVTNPKIEIVYWRINGQFRIQFVAINDTTDMHMFGKYIGETAEDILKYFNRPSSRNEHEISYTSSDWQYFVNFEISNKKVTKIVLGFNI
jgi:hypothetical protein